MRHQGFLRRNAFNSLAVVGLLIPAADIVRREVVVERSDAGEATLADSFAAPRDTSAALAVVEVPTPLVPPPALAVHVPDRKVERAAEAGLGDAVSSVNAALTALAPHVTRASHGDALASALQAYFAYRAANPGRVTKPYLYYVDLGLDNLTPRGYVFDMEELSLVDGPFMVSHGSGSGPDGVPGNFSNRLGSNASSLGLYLAQETYAFSGKAAGRAYTSVGLRLQGESGDFNDAARRRGIVVHGAPYVTATRAGRSQGCPAMEPQRAARLLPMLANGGVVFIYSPNDARWPGADPWVQALQLASN